MKTEIGMSELVKEVLEAIQKADTYEDAEMLEDVASRLTELEKDRERLDKLSSLKWWHVKGLVVTQNNTLREAIDAAMEATK